MRETGLSEMFFTVAVNPFSQSSSSKNPLPSSIALPLVLSLSIFTGSVRQDSLSTIRSCLCASPERGRSISTLNIFKNILPVFRGDMRILLNLIVDKLGWCQQIRRFGRRLADESEVFHQSS